MKLSYKLLTKFALGLLNFVNYFNGVLKYCQKFELENFSIFGHNREHFYFQNFVFSLFLFILFTYRILFFIWLRFFYLILISHRCIELEGREWKEVIRYRSMINTAYHLSLINSKKLPSILFLLLLYTRVK